MKNRVILLLVILTAVVFAGCTNSSEKVQTLASEKEAVEKLSSELYPAYIMEKSQEKWGYINEEGKFIIEPKYENAADFHSNGMAEVLENGRWRLIDSSGKLIMESQYLYASDFSEEAIVVSDDSGKSYLLDSKGRILFQTEGSIDKLSCGIAAFSKKLNEDKSLWGYINSEGKAIIEPKYEWAQTFSNNKAIVEIGKGHFGIIDNEGKLLKEIYNERIIGLSEDTFVFSKVVAGNGQKYGYMTSDGEVMLDTVYSAAEGYEDGLAIVNAAESFENEFGIINKNGEFIIPAKYPQITSLGNGIYAVPKEQDVFSNITFMEKALFDKNGKQLTEFRYYDLIRLENGLISATDDKNTYLIDDKGNEISSIPKTEGIGSIKSCGKLYKVEADNKLYYLSQEGKTVWASDNTIRLEGGLEVKMITFRPDRCMLIQYPEVSGVPDLKLQEKINRTLKDKFVGDNKASNKDEENYTDSIEINYTADKNKDLLIISKSGYFYPIGAAHGQPIREDYHIDIKTGNIYTLKDLFKKDYKYKEKLTDIIKGMIVRTNKEYVEQIYSEDIGNLEENSGFEIKKGSLQIYFYPYAIAPYAAGFPEFYIRYDELMDLINTDGEFWKSFDRDTSAELKKPANGIYQRDKAKIEEAVKYYENTIIEAINKNDFELVEPWLYPDSSIYTSQKKLVGDLNQKQIKEKLDSYSIENIEADNYGMIYRIYVTENIGIQYPGKDYTTKQFNWVYSLRYSYEKQKYQFTYINEWDKS